MVFFATPLTPLTPLTYPFSDPSDFFESKVSVRFTGLMGWSSVVLRRSSCLSMDAMPQGSPALACWLGCGVCGRLSKVYVFARLGLLWPDLASGAPVLL